MRDYIDKLLLLPSADNESYGAIPYSENLPPPKEPKRGYYRSQNLLAKSLHEGCYQHNPKFTQFKDKSNLPFEPHAKFQKTDIEKRQQLYREIADKIWHPNRLHDEAKK